MKRAHQPMVLIARPTTAEDQHQFGKPEPWPALQLRPVDGSNVDRWQGGWEVVEGLPYSFAKLSQS
jgi:hypothetical protein